MFAKVPCHHAGVYVKGGDSCVYSWMILLSPFMMRSILFNSAVGVGARRDRKWRVREPEEPAGAHVVHNWKKHKREAIHWKGVLITGHLLQSPPAPSPRSCCPGLPSWAVIVSSFWCGSPGPSVHIQACIFTRTPFFKVENMYMYPCFFQETVS